MYTAFNQVSFEEETLHKFSNLEFKERIYHIRDILKKYLPNDYIEATSILLKVLPEAFR